MSSDPNTLFHRAIFQEVIGKIEGGDVLDLGCGRAGIYYALGYINSVNSTRFYDDWEEKLQILRKEYDQTSPEYLDAEYDSILEYLRSQKFSIPESNEEIASALLTKVKEIRKFDFTKEVSPYTFDHIISIKSIECVSNTEKFINALQNVYKMLKPGGLFSGVVLRYDSIDAKNKLQMVHQFSEGGINPDEQTIIESFQQTGYSTTQTKVINFPNLNPNYSEAVFFHAQKTKDAI